ncbi:MAG TPA: amino acid adenylation domain-containing protein [Longimicrobium sp.]|nr:amino acid adenylation domain-containing protein [Longimicrobium sp.]
MSDLLDRLSALSPAKRALLERARAAAPPATAIPAAPDGYAPLSSEQRRLWYLLQLAPDDSPLYTIHSAFRLRGALDAIALDAALRGLVRRHEPLRTAFRETDGEPVQIVRDGGGFRLEIMDLRGDPRGEGEARRISVGFVRRTFDLARGELFHALLLRVAEDEHHLYLGYHHLAGDGISAGPLLRDLGALYAAHVNGRDADLPPLATRFRDWAAWQRRTAEGARAADEAYWRARLAGAPHVLEVPADRARPAVQEWEGTKHRFAVSPEVTDGLRALARREGTTLYAVTAAALALVLGRYAEEDDPVLGTVVVNRPLPELEALVGFFANTLPLRMRLDGDPTVSTLLRRAHEAAVGAHEHGRLSFDRIVELAGARRDRARTPLVQHVLVFTQSEPSLRLPGIATEPLATEADAAPFDLSFFITDQGSALTGEILYATALYDAATAERIAGHLASALAAFAADPARRISRVTLATAEERRTMAAWSASAWTVPGPLTIPALFERQARATPAATAIVHDAGRWTYAELNARANRIAHALRARGVGPEMRVALAMDRTPTLVATMLGVMKAGGAYAALDATNPPARTGTVLRSARASLVIADAAGRARLPAGVESVDPAALDGGSEVDPDLLVAPENLAFLVFTSGSTGGPKGVEIEHRSAVSLLHHWHAVVMRNAATSLAGSPANFDLSVAEIFGALCFGRASVLVENAVAPLPPGARADAATLVPTAALERLRAGLPAGLRIVTTGGEVVTPALAAQLHAAGVERVTNVYGPTEITVYCTAEEVVRGAERVTVGRPVAGARVYVLDEAMRPAGIGIPGEIWVGGPGVARGYASHPAMTAGRFLPDPHGPAGARMYRTLDRGRWLADGSLEFLGRRDAQVKVRGYRVELEEVEEALAAHPAVAAAAASVIGAGTEARIGAWVIARGGERPDAAEMRAFARERLPAYMVPASFAWLDALPRTTSGKLDRRALPAHGGESTSIPVLHVGPRSPLEERLAALWREVLGVERVGVHDDFFDLGGQSILATRLMSRMHAEIGVRLPVAELLRGPTIEQVARLIAGVGRRDEREARLPLVPLQPLGDRPPLFLGHPGGGHVVCYRTLADLLAPRHPVYGLQARGIDDGRPPLGSVEEMAAHYLEGIRAFRPRGPYHLAGWSYGGMLAWEMARQLRAAGEEVALLALLDAGSPVPRESTAETLEPARILQRIIADLVGWGAASLVKVDRIRRLPPREQALAAIRVVNLPKALPVTRLDEVLALTAVRAANLRAMLAYRPAPYAGHVTYVRTAGSDRMFPREPGLEFWSALAAGGLTVHRVTGSHGTILHQPHVSLVASHLAAAISGEM